MVSNPNATKDEAIELLKMVAEDNNNDENVYN
jgi:hypothetical protein